MTFKRTAYTLFLFLVVAAPARAEEPLRWFWSAGLGIYACSINQSLNEDLKLDRNQGLLVLAVARASAANQVGIKPGDIVSRFTPGDLWSEDARIGTVELVRQGTPLTLTVRTKKVADDVSLDLLRVVRTRPPSTFTVDPQGGRDFKTLTGALFQATAGDTILLKPAVYSEAVFITEGVLIRPQAQSTAHVESQIPWLAKGVAKLQIHGITFSGTALFVQNGDAISIDDCSFLAAEKKSGIVLNDANGVKLERDTFSGGAETNGVSAYNSQLLIADSYFSGSGTAATLRHGTRADFRNNVVDATGNGLLSSESELVVSKSLFAGKWDGQDSAASFGIHSEKSALNVTKSSIRGHRYGIVVLNATRPATIADSAITQTQDAVSFLSSSGTISGSLIMENSHEGIYIGKMEQDSDPAPRDVKILRNTVSQNESVGILVVSFNDVAVRENLIEANGAGVQLNGARASVENNTITLQKYTGVLVRAKSDVKIFNNVVAFNSFGLFIDVDSRRELAFNDVYGNLARTDFPLIDGNYGRTDRYTTADGRKIPIDVYPAYDLRAENDVNLDPGFVKLGSNYNFKSDSRLSQLRGRDRRLLGAFAPAVADESSASGAEPSSTKRSNAQTSGNGTQRAARAADRGNSAARAPRRESTSAALAESEKYVSLGDDYMARSKWNEAIAAYNQAIAAAANNAEAYYSLGWAYNQMGRHGEAFAPLVKAVQLDSQFAEAHFGIGYAYLHSDNFTKAIPFFKTAIKLDSDFADAHYCLGQAYLGLGDKNSAMHEYTVLKDLDPKAAQELMKEIER